MTEEIETQENKKLPVLRGELALLVVVLINSLGVVLMLYSGSGISAISSVPYAFSEVFNKISLGTWTYIFQGLLVLSLMIMRKKFVAPYLFSFVVGFAFSEMLDVHEMWIGVLPTAIGYRVLYFIISYSAPVHRNRTFQPLRSADHPDRPVSERTGRYHESKIFQDQDRLSTLPALPVTALMTCIILGHLDGLGIGTILAAFTMGKVIGMIGDKMDQSCEI